MKEKVKFYRCPICGNVIELIDGNINNITCCNQKMVELTANIVDASQEKHVPVYEEKNSEIIVKVGEVEHPMEESHYIMWIAQVTDNAITRINLKPREKAVVNFSNIKDSIIYVYCNKHGLWKTIVK